MEKFTDFIRRNGFYVLAAVCVIALAAAIGIISATTPSDNSLTNENQNELAVNADPDNDSEYTSTESENDTIQITENTDPDTEEEPSEKTNEADNSTDSAEAASTQPITTAFDDSQTLAWPVQGDLLMRYSMNTTTYFKTLNQYQCNPGLLISAQSGDDVRCAYSGIIESVTDDPELGTCITMNIGNDYRITYGQLKDIIYNKGDQVMAGSLLGHVAEPTKYYTLEGSHLYFEVTNDEIPVDPEVYLENTQSNQIALQDQE